MSRGADVKAALPAKSNAAMEPWMTVPGGSAGKHRDRKPVDAVTSRSTVNSVDWFDTMTTVSEAFWRPLC